MKKTAYFLIHYPLSLLCIVAVWWLSLWLLPPHLPMSDVQFIDKWTHIVMYCGTCSMIWIEYHRAHRTAPSVPWTKVLTWAWLAPALMSGLLELLQEYCTGGHRSGEWLDFAANVTGCTLAIGVGFLYKKIMRKE